MASDYTTVQPWNSQRVRQLRAHLDLSQDDFAERVGVRVTTVRRWEHGKRAPQRLARQRLDALAREAGL